MDALFIAKRLQKENLQKDRKLYLRYADLEKAFDRDPGWSGLCE